MRLTILYYRSRGTFIYSTGKIRNDRCYRNRSDTPLWLAFDSQSFVLMTSLHWQILYIYILRTLEQEAEYKTSKSIVGWHNGITTLVWPRLCHIYFVGWWSQMSYNHRRPLHSPCLSLSFPPLSLSIIIFNKTYSANSLMTAWKFPLLKLTQAHVSGCVSSPWITPFLLVLTRLFRILRQNFKIPNSADTRVLVY